MPVITATGSISQKYVAAALMYLDAMKKSSRTDSLPMQSE